MPYSATALNVMIAAPGDIEIERSIIQTAVHDWNAVHSKDRNLILVPVGWDSHSAPVMGNRPQAIINTQVLKDADLLVAVFWTRLGSPTGEAASGTVEEIERHISEGKPAMIYFSNKPAHPDSIDDEQYQALKAFRDDCKKGGLIETYETLEEFKAKFWRQLATTIIREFGNLGVQSTSPPSTGAPPSALRELFSETAQQLLLEVSKDDHGLVMCIPVLGGLIVQTNGRQLAEMGNPRSEQRWRDAIRELVGAELLEERGHDDEMFALTTRGYEIADKLRAEALR